MDDFNNGQQAPAEPDNNNQQDNNEASRFAQVKSRALDELMKVLPDANELDPERRFEIYMSNMRSLGDVQSAQGALDAAMAIQDHSKRADALSDLIDEVEYRELRDTAS